MTVEASPSLFQEEEPSRGVHASREGARRWAEAAGKWTFDRLQAGKAHEGPLQSRRIARRVRDGQRGGPGPSPKPILQNVKLVADPEEGSILMATDLEVGIRHRVMGMKVDQPGSVILPTARIGSILRTSNDDELDLEADGDHLVVRGLHSEFKLPGEDPSLYPEVPDFAATSYHVVKAADLRKLIRRTMFATDVESTRYALGGVLVELTAESITMVGTDGRRLAKMSAPAEAENGAASPDRQPGHPRQGTEADRAQPRRR